MHETLYPVVRFISDHSLILTALAAVAVMMITAIIPIANYLEPRWRPADPVYLGWAVGVVHEDAQQFFQIGRYGRYAWPHGRDSVEVPTPTIRNALALRCVFGQDAQLVMGIAYPSRIQEQDQHIRIHSSVISGGTAVLGSKPVPVEIPWENTTFLYLPIFVKWDDAETWGQSHTWNLNRTYAIREAHMAFPQQKLAEPFVLRENPSIPRCSPGAGNTSTLR